MSAGSTAAETVADSGRADPPLLRVRGLRKHFPLGQGLFRRARPGVVKAVDGVDLDVRRGETLGLVGESGSGKTTAGRCILRLIEPTAGTVELAGEDVLRCSRKRLRLLRRQMQIIFQDPYSSLDPRMNVGAIVGEPLAVHRLARRGRERNEKVAALLERVGLNPAQARRYPHEFSGGQRQRIGIARALALNPSFIVADEPVSALDLSIRAQVINLLQDLQEERGLSYLFIAHDLRVVEHISHRIAVIYLGRIVETAPTEELVRRPRHPYTRALHAAVPVPDPAAGQGFTPLPGEPPSPVYPPAGCSFHPRCPEADERCGREAPRLRRIGDDHHVSCHMVD